jgi:hypothetical protein
VVIGETPVAVGQEQAQLGLRLREPTDGDETEGVSKSEIESDFPRGQWHRLDLPRRCS